MQVSPITQDGFQTIDSSCPDSDRIHVCSGNLVKTIQLFSIPTFGLPLRFSLYHNALNVSPAGDVGIGWRHSGQAQLNRETSTASLVVFTDETGRPREFEKVGSDWVLQDNSFFANVQLSELGGGVWQLSYEPRGPIFEFTELSGEPVVARLTRIVDRDGNELLYEYNLSDQLVEIVEPVSERAITLGWTDGYLSSVTDPGSFSFTLSYTDDLLTTVEMPDGCLLEHTYDGNNRVASRSDRLGASTLYGYDGEGRLIEVQGPEEDEVRPTVSWEYSEDPVEEVLNHDFQTETLKQVFFTNARGKTWEYRFLENTMLWRVYSRACPSLLLGYFCPKRPKGKSFSSTIGRMVTGRPVHNRSFRSPLPWGIRGLPVTDSILCRSLIPIFSDQ